MKILNFYPYYEPYLRSGSKTTTIRIHAPDFKKGEIVRLTVGWNEKEVRNLHQVEIVSLYSKCISSLEAADFEGESPDCREPEATALVLSSIYRMNVDDSARVWVVKFKHLIG